MIKQYIRDKLNADTIVFDNPSFDNSIIGMTFDGRAIYSMELMVAELMDDDNCGMEEAVEFIEYNTLRTIPYIGSNAPIVICLDEVI